MGSLTECIAFVVSWRAAESVAHVAKSYSRARSGGGSRLGLVSGVSAWLEVRIRQPLRAPESSPQRSCARRSRLMALGPTVGRSSLSVGELGA